MLRESWFVLFIIFISWLILFLISYFIFNILVLLPQYTTYFGLILTDVFQFSFIILILIIYLISLFKLIRRYLKYKLKY